MSLEKVSGFEYHAEDPRFGFEGGKFYVEPATNIPEDTRVAVLSSVYARSAEEIFEKVVPYAPVVPTDPKHEAVYAHVNVKNKAGVWVPYPIGVAVGSHEKVGRLGSRTKVANINSVFVRAIGDEVALGHLRGHEVGYGLLDGLLERFDPTTKVTIFDVPTMNELQAKKADVALKALGFAKRGTKAPKNASNKEGVWYEGQTVQDLQNQLAALSRAVKQKREYYNTQQDQADTKNMRELGGLKSRIFPLR